MVTSYDECVQAGYPVMESYPEQCSDGTRTFTNNEVVVEEESPEILEELFADEDEQELLEELLIEDSYQIIGLSEADASASVEQQGGFFRVVDRDGQFLPVTADYVPGRINAIVQNDIVVDYHIEGADSE